MKLGCYGEKKFNIIGTGNSEIKKEIQKIAQKK